MKNNSIVVYMFLFRIQHAGAHDPLFRNLLKVWRFLLFKVFMFYEVYRDSLGDYWHSSINNFTVYTKEIYTPRAARMKKGKELKNVDNSLENRNRKDSFIREL